jgi:hypothetical protein
LHKIGLGASSADQAFYTIDKNNYGLGTFSPVEHYDLPLKEIGTFRVERGDDYILSLGDQPIDAIKIDVQGYESEVLNGLQETLAKFRPVVWFEYGPGTKTKFRSMDESKALFPYEAEWLLMMPKTTLFHHTVELEPVTDKDLPLGDYIVVPAEKVG